jgi:hypothetical protein
VTSRACSRHKKFQQLTYFGLSRLACLRFSNSPPAPQNPARTGRGKDGGEGLDASPSKPTAETMGAHKSAADPLQMAAANKLKRVGVKLAGAPPRAPSGVLTKLLAVIPTLPKRVCRGRC